MNHSNAVEKVSTVASMSRLLVRDANIGQIWLGSNADGVVIAGQIDSLSLDERIEIRVSSTMQLRLPMIGWPEVALFARSDCKSPLRL